jgi:hypothetical protein
MYCDGCARLRISRCLASKVQHRCIHDDIEADHAVLRVAAHRIGVNRDQAHKRLMEALYLQLLLVPTNKQATARTCRYQHAHASGTSLAIAVEVHCWQACVVLL